MTSALESSIHMAMSLRAGIKESLSPDSQNGGNLPAGSLRHVERDWAHERLTFSPFFWPDSYLSRQFEAALNHSGGCAVPGEKGIQHLSLTVDKLPRIWCGRLNRPRAAEGLETCCRGSPESPSRR